MTCRLETIRHLSICNVQRPPRYGPRGASTAFRDIHPTTEDLRDHLQDRAAQAR
jgi:hypothetical protein